MEEGKIIKGANWTAISIVALLVVGGVGFSYTQVIRDKNNLDKQKIEQDAAREKQSADLERAKLDQERQLEEEKMTNEQVIKQQEVNRELEADCQKRVQAMKYQYNNVENGYYSDGDNTCYVVYRDTATGANKTSDINDMVNSKNN